MPSLNRDDQFGPIKAITSQPSNTNRTKIGKPHLDKLEQENKVELRDSMQMSYGAIGNELNIEPQFANKRWILLK